MYHYALTFDIMPSCNDWLLTCEHTDIQNQQVHEKILHVRIKFKQQKGTGVLFISGIINEFSALCFMFARDLQKHLKYPIGVIESDWGGTPIEVWSGPDATSACPTTSALTPFVIDYANFNRFSFIVSIYVKIFFHLKIHFLHLHLSNHFNIVLKF